MPAPDLGLALHDTLAMARLFAARERGRLGLLLLDSLLIPAALCYLGLLVVGDSSDGRAWFLTGGVTMGLGTGAIYLVGAAVLDDRFQGRLELLRVQPTVKLAYYAANVGLAVVSALALMAAALGVLWLVGLAAITMRTVLAGLLLALLAGGSLGGLGGALASRARDYDFGYTTLSAASLGLACASPVFYPEAALPIPLRAVAQLSPLTHAGAVMRTITETQALPLWSPVALVALAVALNVGAYRLLRW